MKSIPIPSPGDVIAGQYRLDEVLGRGGFGMVFKATHLEMKRPVALKTLLPGAATSPKAIERFKRESVLASSLKHPNTITLFDYGQSEEGLLYLVMELLEGQTLKEALDEGGPMASERAEVIFHQVLESLEHAHSKGIVHLDLKPENIFLCKDLSGGDHVKVLDFGIARILVDNEGQRADLSQSMSYGTARYMAPEQISALPVGPQTDLYALGLILHEVLVGEPAYTGRTPLEIVAKQLQQDTPDLEPSLAQTPLGQIYGQIAVKAFDDRLGSAGEALSLLESLTNEAMSLQTVAEAPVEFPAQPEIDLAGATGLIDEDWPSIDPNFDNLLSETPMPGDVPEGELDEEHTWVVGAKDVEGLIAKAEATAHFLTEGRLDPVDDLEPMDADPTRVMDGFESEKTEALYTLSENDLMELAAPSDVEEMESEPTRVHVSRTGQVAAIVPMSEARVEPSQGVSNKIEDTEKTDPNRVSEEEADQPPKERAVLFSVGAEAGYIGEARGVPGVHEPSNVDIAAVDRLDRQKHSTGRMQAIEQRPVQIIAGPQQRPVDRTLVAALAFLGLGMIAVLTVLIVILMLPFLRQGPQPPAIAANPAPLQPAAQPEAPIKPVPVAAVPLQDAGVAAAPAATPDTGATPDAKAIAAADVPPARPLITLTSKPTGAAVYVDGKLLGKTPIEVTREDPTGKFELALKLDKHKEHTQTIDYSGDQKLNFDLEALPAEAKPSKPVAAVNKTPNRSNANKSRATPKSPIRTPKKVTRPKRNNTAKKGTGKKKKPSPFGKW